MARQECDYFGGGIVRTLLYSGTPANSTTISLSDALSNYDELSIVVRNSESPAQCGFYRVPVDEIDTNTNINILTGWCDGDIVKYALSFALRKTSDTQFFIVYATCGGWSFGSLKIYGIKY